MEYFDGPALGEDDSEEEWCYNSYKHDPDDKSPDSSTKSAVPVEDIIDDDDKGGDHGKHGKKKISPGPKSLPEVITLTVNYGVFEDETETRKVHRNDCLDDVLIAVTKRYQRLFGEPVGTMFSLDFGTGPMPVKFGTTLDSYMVDSPSATLEVNISLDDEKVEDPFELFANENEAVQARQNRTVPSWWIVLKLQGNADLVKRKHGANVAYVLMKKEETFKALKEFIRKEKEWSPRFKFDGENVAEGATPKSEDMDDLDCVDFVKC
jgi:hypothetical protein